ncbi:TIR domain-containing protein [archaeon]|nr:MAG: TIR domain-containing protein [archaeon]
MTRRQYDAWWAKFGAADQTADAVRCARALFDADDKLHAWYAGVEMSAADAAAQLARQPPGSFFVRVSGERAERFAVTFVRADGAVMHARFLHNAPAGRGIMLVEGDSVAHDNLADLVASLARHPQIQLTRPFAMPLVKYSALSASNLQLVHSILARPHASQVAPSPLDAYVSSGFLGMPSTYVVEDEASTNASAGSASATSGSVAVAPHVPAVDTASAAAARAAAAAAAASTPVSPPTAVGAPSDGLPHGEYDVMLSYNWAYQPTVIRMRDALVAAGYRVWMDVDDMHPSFVHSMVMAVKRSKFIVICSGPKYVASKNCTTECLQVYVQNKQYAVTVMEEGFDPQCVEHALAALAAGRLYIDFSRAEKEPGAFEKSMGMLFKQLTQFGVKPSMAAAASSTPTAALRGATSSFFEASTSTAGGSTPNLMTASTTSPLVASSPAVASPAPVQPVATAASVSTPPIIAVSHADATLPVPDAGGYVSESSSLPAATEYALPTTLQHGSSQYLDATIEDPSVGVCAYASPGGELRNSSQASHPVASALYSSA